MTNRQFAAFVKATGYVTEAERFGWSFVFGLFIGPVLLAVGYSLMSEWTGTRDPIVRQKGEQEA